MSFADLPCAVEMLVLHITELNKRIFTLDDLQRHVESATEDDEQLKVNVGSWGFDFRSKLMNTKIQGGDQISCSKTTTITLGKRIQTKTVLLLTLGLQSKAAVL